MNAVKYWASILTENCKQQEIHSSNTAAILTGFEEKSAMVVNVGKPAV